MFRIVPATPVGRACAVTASTRTVIDKRNIEAILPLTQQQAAMLLYCGKPGIEDLGFLQVQFDLRGEFDPDIWRETWTNVIKRHESMRMSINAPEGKPAMAVCWKQVDLPWHVEDLSHLREPERLTSIEEYRRREHEQGLDLGKAPVMRVATFQLEPDCHRVLWCCHHLLLDGWSSSLVLRDAMSMYRALKSGVPATAGEPVSYRKYRGHLRGCDNLAAREYWRDQLTDIPEPLQLCRESKGGGRRLFQSESHTLSVEDSTRLQKSISARKVPAGALIRGAWAIALHQLLGREDVLFGSVVSGRGADFPGIESLVGFLANTVPTRVHVDSEASLDAWLRNLRDEQLRSQLYEDVPLAEILAESERRSFLFDHLLLIENLPPAQSETGDHLQITNYSSPVTSNFPLTVTVVPGPEWGAKMIFDTQVFEEEWIRELLHSLCELLKRMSGHSVTTVGETAVGLRFPVLPDVAETVPSPDEKEEREYTGPRNPCELELLRVWQDVLQSGPVGIHDDFFDLGGRSLQALRLFDEIHKRFDQRLPPATLLQHSTVALMARLLQQGEPESTLKCLVPIQSGSVQPPLFCIHAGGGHVLFYRDLAQALGSQYRVYGLQPVGLDGTDRPLKSVEKMASRYLEEIRLVQNRGPYYFLAHCFGASVALEMAHQLRACGEEVSNLFLLDAASPLPSAPWIDHPDRSALWNLGHVIRNSDWKRLRWAIRFHTKLSVRDFLRPYLVKWRRTEAARTAGYLEAVQQTCYRALFNYRPREYTGPVVLLRSNDNQAVQERELIEDWKAIAPNLEVEQFPFGHRSFLVQPHVRDVAAFVDSRFNQSS